MTQKGIVTNIVFTIIVFFATQICYGQYLISGYVDSEHKNKTVYLSLLKYDEEYLMTENQILFSTKTDSTGYFEFKGQLLSEKDKLYRIHSNLLEGESLQLMRSSNGTNFHNFIFSNKDTIYFPKIKDNWFSNSHNSNKADKEWEKFRYYEKRITQGLSQAQNDDVKRQEINDFVSRIKIFGQDSLSHPLVKLLTYSYIKRTGFDIKSDFKRDPDFYYDIQKALNTDYFETPYYLKYQDELSKLSYSIIRQKYVLHKNLNYILSILVFVLSVVLLFLIRKLRTGKIKKAAPSASNLTSQEEKIVKLICEGKSNKEIADELFISLSTVKTHIRNVYAKLNVTNRQELTEKIKNHPGD